MRKSRRTLLVPVFSVCLATVLLGCQRSEKEASADQTTAAPWQDYRLGEFAEATRKFNQILQTAPTDTEAKLEAEYGLACIAGFESDSNEQIAKPMFEKIATTAPNSPWAAWSRLAIVRLAQQVRGTDTPDARSQLVDAYSAVVRDFPGSQAADEAYVYQQSVRLISLNPDDARQVAADLTLRLDRHDSKFTSALYDLRSLAYRISGQFKESLADAVASVASREVDPQNPAPVDASKLYAIGVMAQYDVGDFATARRYYQQFLDSYPTDPRAFPVRQLLKDMDKTDQSLQHVSTKESP